IHVGTFTAAASINYYGPAGSERALQWNTAGLRRWRFRTNSNAETGSNAGSNFDLIATADNGTTNTTVATWTRSTGAVRFFGDTRHDGTTNTFNGGIFRSGTVTWSGSQGQPGNYMLWLQTTYTGSVSGGTGVHLNHIEVTDKVADVLPHDCLSISYFPSTGTAGGVGLDVRVQDDATTGSTVFGNIGVRSTINMLYNQSGTADHFSGEDWCLLLAAGDNLGAVPPGVYYSAMRMIEF